MGAVHHRTPGRTVNGPASGSGEPRSAWLASWLVLAASFGLSAATWVALGVLAGFVASASVFGVVVRLAWLLPVAVDGYVVVALVLWMSPVPARVARFARINTYTAAGVGVVAQSAYHALSVFAATGEAWRCGLAAVVGALPPAVTALAVHMRALIRRESGVLAAQPATVTNPAVSTRSVATTETALTASTPVTSRPLPAAPLDPLLLAAARKTAETHRATTGRPVDAELLRAELRVSAATAADLLAAIAAPVNGELLTTSGAKR